MQSLMLRAFVQDAAALPQDAPISLETRELPLPKAGQLRVRMIGAPIHPSDFNWMEGTYHAALERMVWNQGERTSFDPDHSRALKRPPFVLGVEGCGVVEAVGPGTSFVGRRLLGKRVAVSADAEGTWQEVTLIDERRAIPVPSSLSDGAAATLFVNPLTTVAMITRVLRVPAGERLLITAAGSALGQMAIRVCRSRGIEPIAVVRRDAAVAGLQALGATVISTQSGSLREQVAAATGGRGVRYAIDCVGGELGTQVLCCLAPGAHVLLYGTLDERPISLLPRDLLMPAARVEGFFLPAFLATQSLWAKMRLIREVTRLIEQGVLVTKLDGGHRLADYRAAFARARDSQRVGKPWFRFA